MIITEPIHFFGPSPGDQSAIIAEEEKKEEPETSQPDKTIVTDYDDPLGPARQSITKETTAPAHKVIKEPEPTQTVESAGRTTMGAPSVDAPPKVSQQPIETAQRLADANQATLLAVQQLQEQMETMRQEMQS